MEHLVPRGSVSYLRDPLCPSRPESVWVPNSPSPPVLFQGGVSGVEIRTRREEELYNPGKQRRTSGYRDRQFERGQEMCKEH